MTEITKAPHSHSQPSRKSKRAWRKNIDIAEVQDGLSIAREEERLTGGQLFADIPSDALYEIDSTPDVAVQKQYRTNHRPLRSDEILAQRSAVPAVDSRKRKGDEGKFADGLLPEKRRKGNGVSGKELERLKMIAYRGEAMQKDIVQTDETAEYDPWAVSAPTEEEVLQPEATKRPAKRAPETLRHAPMSLTASGRPVPAVSHPNAGRSYNPSFPDWERLLDQEGSKEISAEAKRLHEASEAQKREERVAAAGAEAERGDAAAEYSEYESEWDGILSDMDEAQLARKRPQRKTPAERNKIKKRKGAAAVARHEAKMKIRGIEHERAREGAKSVDAQEDIKKDQVAKVEEGEAFENFDDAQQLRRRRFGKHYVPDAPLEVVLADELKDSLRLLKPEGNLLKDRFRNMMVQGKVEVRRPVGQTRKAKTKSTEKWSYKDWKLPVQAT